jgi:hypothetical protein
MEARQTLTKGSFFPKALMVVLAVCGTIALAAMGAVITRDQGRSNAPVQTQVHPAAGTVLRQDNPAIDSGAQVSAPAVSHRGHRIVRQLDADDSDSAAAAGGPQSDLTRVLPTEQAAYDPGWDARSVREGHGA